MGAWNNIVMNEIKIPTTVNKQYIFYQFLMNSIIYKNMQSNNHRIGSTKNQVRIKCAVNTDIAVVDRSKRNNNM